MFDQAHSKLWDTGYAQFYLSFGEGNLRATDWAKAYAGLTGDLRVLVGLFLVKQPQDLKAVTGILGKPFVEALMDVDILTKKGKMQVISNDFFLLVLCSHLYFCQLCAEPWAYYGEDSHALMVYQSPAEGGRTLDLCSGPGIQALVSHLRASESWGVEMKPQTVRVAEVNRKLNLVGNSLCFKVGSYQDFAKRCPDNLDLVTFNPPLVPTPEDWSLEDIGDGGRMGLECTLEILDLYHPRLQGQGRFEFVGIGLSGEGGGHFADELETWGRQNDFHSRIHLLSQHPIRARGNFFEMYVYSLARHNEAVVGEAREALLKAFQESGHEHFHVFFCSLRKASRSNPLETVRIDQSRRFYGEWFL